MSRWLKLVVLAIAATLFAPSGTTTASAAIFTYDAPATGRVDAHVSADTVAAPAQLTGASKWSAPSSVEPLDPPTTPASDPVPLHGRGGSERHP
jgi:hypothetical protein